MFEEYLILSKCGHYRRMPDRFIHRSKPMDYLVLWVLGGCGFVETEGQQVAAHPGQVFTFLPHRPHAYGSDPQQPWEILWAHLEGPLAAEFIRQIRYYGIPEAELGLDAEIRERWEELVVARARRDPGIDLRLNTGACALLGLILYRLLVHTIIPERENPLDATRLQSYIHEHLAKPLTLKDLARQGSLSPTHFARVFKKQFTVSPITYVLQQRVALASSLLADTTMRVKQVSLAVGYEDPYYFSRLFKKMTGLSPTRYRQAKRPRV